MIFTACGHLERVLTIELEKGDDLLKKISEACESEGIKNGFVYGAVGNLEKAAVYTAGAHRRGKRAAEVRIYG